MDAKGDGHSMHGNGSIKIASLMKHAHFTERGWTQGYECTEEVICSDCNSKGCWPVKDYDKYTVTEYGYVKGENEMMQEIY